MPPEQTDQRSSEQDNSLQDINSNVIDPRTAALTQARQQADERRQNIQHGHHTQTQRVATAIKLFPLADSVNFVHKELRFTSGMEMKVGRVSGSRNQRESKQDNGVFLCDVMSREHALLQEIDGKIWIKDMKSTHGTFINNYRIGNGTAASEFYPLKHKDVITFGHSVRRNQNLYKHLSAYVWYPSESGGMDPPFPVVLDRREINPAQNAPANNATTNGIGNGIVGNGVGNNYTARQRDIENGNTNTRLIPPHSNARPDHTDRTNNHSQPPVHRDIRTHTAPPQPQNQEPKTEAIEIESDAENDLIQERENAPEEKDKQPKSQQEEAASTSNDTNGVNNNNNSAVSNDNNVAKKEQVTSTILREVASDLVKKEHVTSISSTEKKEQVPPTTLKDVNKSKDHSHHSKSKESTIPNSKGFPLPKSKDSANIEQTKDPSSNERSITNHQNDVSKIPIPIATKSNELSDKRNRDPQLMEFEHNEIRNDNNQSESFDRKHDYQLSDVQRDMDLDEIKTDNDKMIKNDYGNKEERSLTARKRTYEEMENEGYEIVPSKEYVDELRRRLAVAERKRKRIKWEVVGTVIAGMLFGAGGVIVLGS
ncbi:3601_t:CDS:2 [Ambispora gerdemannii]|uniref:3601_t:CDS:1 n=1 Tax=Ambispora gerdemannii TaxID=144530 RepID=A0A9N9BYX3_9GLOM|nr:3601_t:CDS:2 [Ambispora gerdemannii]